MVSIQLNVGLPAGHDDWVGLLDIAAEEHRYKGITPDAEKIRPVHITGFVDDYRSSELGFESFDMDHILRNHGRSRVYQPERSSL